MQISRYLHQLRACADHRTPLTAKLLHAHLLKIGINHDEPIPNTLLNSYAKCNLIFDAHQLFDEMPQRDHVSWATILTSYNLSNLPHKTLSIFPSMFNVDGLHPDHFVYASLIRACSASCAFLLGKQVHARFFKSSFCDDDVVKSSLVDMYAKCGVPVVGRKVFDSIWRKNPVSWTAMVSGYARSGMKVEAMEMFWSAPVRNLYLWTALISGLVQSGHGLDGCSLFIEMRREGVDIVDPLVVSSVVGACANLAVLELGRQVHGLVIALGYDSCLFVSNAFVDMYAKCSDIVSAKDIFVRMSCRDVVSWTSIIVGVAQHGGAMEALELFDKMVSAGVKPNEVTVVGLIYACSHAGLVSKGRALFKSMTEDYGILPSLQHFTCLLDLLSRSGHFRDAEDVINTMPFDPDEPTWAALLSACQHHKNTKMGVKFADRLLSLNPEDPSTYILLSNVYAAAGLWERVSMVRKLMSTMDMKKKPGYSSIELGKETQVFHAGETCHTMKDEIFALLKDIGEEMWRRGYVPDTNSVLHDMEEQEKERQLFWHSERLAVAFGLLKSSPGTVIRIVKNLRVCGDCHTYFKFLSSIVQREIILRDLTRYHHFKDGICSCNDFW